MFAARFPSSLAKNLRSPPSRLTIISLFFGLLIGLPALTMAEDAAPDTSSENTTPAASAVQENDDSGKQKGRVARAIFTSAIANREPVDELSTVTGDTQRIFFFTDLRELAGQIVTHRWEFNGNVMAEVTFKVGDGARWRVYSSKNLLPEWTGQWTVVVSNESGLPINTSTFEYSAKAAEKTADKTTAGTSAKVSP